MRLTHFLGEKIETLTHTAEETLNKNFKTIDDISALFSNTLKEGRTIFWCGNGGSASESSHLATELVGRFKSNRMGALQMVKLIIK